MAKKDTMPIKHSVHLPQNPHRLASLYDRFFDLLHRRRSCIELPDFIHPQIDIHETESILTLEIELPGMWLQDISFRVDSDIVHIRGEKRRAVIQNGGAYVRMERRYGTFARMIRLPAEAHTEKVNTAYSNGILKLMFIKIDIVATEK